ncbi:MAG: NAD-binding protein [Acidobacteriota bacterium]
MNELSEPTIVIARRRRAGTRWRKHILQPLRDYRWTVLVVLAVTALLLGWYGFWVHKAEADSLFLSRGGFSWRKAPGLQLKGYSWLDTFYLGLQLFTLESSVVINGDVALPLQVARILAPAVTGATAALALLAVLSDQFQLFRLGFVKNHVVICGLGAKGWLFARRFKEHGARVVVIEHDTGNPMLEQCRELGIFVLQGSATDSEILSKAQISKAQLLISVCSDDGINAEVAAKVRELASNRDNRFLDCYVHIVDPRLCDLLKEREIAAGRKNGFMLHFFNVYDSGVRGLLGEHPPAGNQHLGQRHAPPHMLVIGLGPLGENLVVHAARQWNDCEAGQRGECLSVTVVDQEAEMKVAVLSERYPKLRSACQLTALQMSIHSPEFEKAQFLAANDGPDITSVYVCLDADASSLSAALAVFQQMRDQSVPVALCVARDASLATLVREINSSLGDYKNLSAFDLLERTCQLDLLLGGTNETLARLIHEDYASNQQKSGASPKTNPSMVTWEELPESMKVSNRAQAAHIGEKLATVGCALRPLTDWGARAFDFEPREIELMARLEHHRWVEERQREGWRFDPEPKDIARKTSPHLVDWEGLPEEVREYDRNTVRALSAFLARAGYQIYRRK